MSTRTINGVTLALLQGDIVKVQADAIVNAANSALAGGGGVDGAIHRAGGPSIMQACREIGGCPTGSAVATDAGRLSAKYVFHAVGPISVSSFLVLSSFIRTFTLRPSTSETSRFARNRWKPSMIGGNFPSLSTGIYGYPLHLAAPIALRTITEHIKKPTSLKQVIMVLYGDSSYQAFEDALKTFG